MQKSSLRRSKFRKLFLKQNEASRSHVRLTKDISSNRWSQRPRCSDVLYHVDIPWDQLVQLVETDDSWPPGVRQKISLAPAYWTYGWWWDGSLCVNDGLLMVGYCWLLMAATRWDGSYAAVVGWSSFDTLQPGEAMMPRQMRAGAAQCNCEG